MASEAQRRAEEQYRARHLTRMEIKPYKEEGAAIDAAAAAAEETRQGYIFEAIHRRMASEGRPMMGGAWATAEADSTAPAGPRPGLLDRSRACAVCRPFSGGAAIGLDMPEKEQFSSETGSVFLDNRIIGFEAALCQFSDLPQKHLYKEFQQRHSCGI